MKTLLLFILLSPFGIFAQQPCDFANLIREGDTLTSKGEYDKAHEKYNAALNCARDTNAIAEARQKVIFTELMFEANVALAEREYKSTLNKLNAARAISPENSKLVDKFLQRVFTSIEQEKQMAEEERQRAMESQRRAEEALRRAMESQRRAEEERQRAMELQRRVEEERRRRAMESRQRTQEAKLRLLIAEKLPPFPWPPPQCAERQIVAKSLNQSNQTFADLDFIICRTLDAKGYTQRSYFQTPNGFAIVTKLEQFDEETGCSQNGDIRWADYVINPIENFFDYLESLIIPKSGYFRLFVFVITDTP